MLRLATFLRANQPVGAFPLEFARITHARMRQHGLMEPCGVESGRFPAFTLFRLTPLGERSLDVAKAEGRSDA